MADKASEIADLKAKLRARERAGGYEASCEMIRQRITELERDDRR